MAVDAPTIGVPDLLALFDPAGISPRPWIVPQDLL